MHNHLKGKFHAHITLLTDDSNFVPPTGWKTTIILLAKGDRVQKDVMITRHYVSDTLKTPDVNSMLANVHLAADRLQHAGHKVVRKKLEHESLPTVEISERTYRECHIKIKKRVTDDVFIPEGFVKSSNPMEVKDSEEIVFLNARFYTGDVGIVDQMIHMAVGDLVFTNHLMQTNIQVLETKIESTVYDSNLGLDKWWA